MTVLWLEPPGLVQFRT
jgi:hypothetical protein